MKTHSILVAAAIAGGISIAPAQDKPASGVKAAEVNPGLLNTWLRQQSPEFTKWDIGGQFRARFESKQDFGTAGVLGASDFKRVGGVDNNYLLLREKLHVGYTPVREFSIYVEGRNSSSHSDERSPDVESDFIDLHQAFITLGHRETFPVTAKIGRQELNYGDERLVGSFDWNNIGRVFDAAKARFENDTLWVDAFAGRVVMPDDHNFNEANDYDIFSGLYASTKKL